MIKKISELTEEDKKKYFGKTKEELNKQSGLPWLYFEEKMQAFLDSAFDDEKFPKMSSDDQIYAAYIRKEFGKNKSSIVDYIL